MRILITGITGFVGTHLAEHLLGVGGHTIAGLVRSNWQAWRLNHIALFPSDLCEPSTYATWLAKYQPDWVFHLAGCAATKGVSEADYQNNNVDATRSLYAELAKLQKKPRVLFTSTGLVYGSAKTPQSAFTETAPLLGQHPYHKSKIAAEALAATSGLDVVTVRLFNQVGPGQSTEYAVPRYAKLIAQAERGDLQITGNYLDSTRDFTDIRDVVRAFRMLMEQGTPGETYNAGSGKSYTIRAVVEKMLTLSSPPVTMSEGERGTPDFSLADVTKLHQATGWQPQIPFEQTLGDVLNYWRQEISPRSASS
jgi:GDP-4-dehydro-6-deoxy-D-mannose reductase